MKKTEKIVKGKTQQDDHDIHEVSEPEPCLDVSSLSRNLNYEEDLADDVPMAVDPREGPIPQETPREPSPFNQPARNQPELLPEYSMERTPRGICVIINIENVKGYRPRHGTVKDRDSLKKIFEQLAFKVLIHDDLSNTQIVETLKHVADDIDHTDYDCFVCCILTHGGMGYLLGSNRKQIFIKDLTSKFQANHCPSLAGKPKLFFFQACQGEDKMGGGMIKTDTISSFDEIDEDRVYVPNTADFLLGYATDAKYMSFRHEEHGSWYIRKLVEMLEVHRHKHDLMSILTKVNEEVSCYAAKEVELPDKYKQIPSISSTLRMKVYFR